MVAVAFFMTSTAGVGKVVVVGCVVVGIGSSVVVGSIVVGSFVVAVGTVVLMVSDVEVRSVGVGVVVGVVVGSWAVVGVVDGSELYY